MPDYDAFITETRSFIAHLQSSLPTLAPKLARIETGIVPESGDVAPLIDLIEEILTCLALVPKDRRANLIPVIDMYLHTVDRLKLEPEMEHSLRPEIEKLRAIYLSLIRGGDVTENIANQKMPRSTRGLFQFMGKEPNPPELAMCIRLTGDKVRGGVVELGSKCELTVDFGQVDQMTIVEVTGTELKRAREEKVEVEFVLYSNNFIIEGNVTRILTRFTDRGFENKVQFHLIAPEKLTTKQPIITKLYLEMQIKARPAVRIPIQLKVVDDIAASTDSKLPAPIRFDLDKIFAAWQRPQPAALLQIVSGKDTGEPSASLWILSKKPVTYLSTGRRSEFEQTSIAAKLRQISVQIDAIQNQVVLDFVDPLKPTPTEQNIGYEALARVASAGFDIYDWLYHIPNMSPILDAINQLAPGSHILVQSDSSSIPWEVMYPERYVFRESEPFKNKVNATHFWGYKYQFEMVMTPGQHDLPEGDIDSGLDRHRQSERKLTAVMQYDIDEQRVWKAGLPVEYQVNAFQSPPPIANVELKKSCDEIHKFLEEENVSGLLVYFYCHGGGDVPYSEAPPTLEVGKQCNIYLKDLDDNKKFIDKPIVFINACSSQALAPVYFDSFTARFLKKGALGLITTTFAVPTQFAARFGCELIRRYMTAKETLGDILFAMRRDALNLNIPAGLFYMLRGPADASLRDEDGQDQRLNGG